MQSLYAGPKYSKRTEVAKNCDGSGKWRLESRKVCSKDINFLPPRVKFWVMFSSTVGTYSSGHLAPDMRRMMLVLPTLSSPSNATV